MSDANKKDKDNSSPVKTPLDQSPIKINKLQRINTFSHNIVLVQNLKPDVDNNIFRSQEDSSFSKNNMNKSPEKPEQAASSSKNNMTKSPRQALTGGGLQPKK